MQISSRFTIAVHALICIEMFKNDRKVTSDFIASSVNVNPVVIRRLLQQLKKAGIVQVMRGSGGTDTARPIDEITLLDIYNAVECVDEGGLFTSTKIRTSSAPLGETFTLFWMSGLMRFRKQWKKKWDR